MNYGIFAALVLLGILALTFYKYERKRINVKEIALLGTLAGIAGVSRVPFAAIPNVQPTTFIVIITGYVFGPSFGFMVGLIATVVSNSFLGHGPWTPWQMLAWGCAGFTGGLLGKLYNKPHKLMIGIFAFIWGFLFDYIMNFWHWVFFIYPLNLKSLMAVFASSLFFDISHAIGNFVFAYLFGGDFINILRRFKNRLSYTEIPYEKID